MIRVPLPLDLRLQGALRGHPGSGRGSVEQGRFKAGKKALQVWKLR